MKNYMSAKGGSGMERNSVVLVTKALPGSEEETGVCQRLPLFVFWTKQFKAQQSIYILLIAHRQPP